MLACLGRHTLTGLACTAGRQALDWSSDCRFFSEAIWHPDGLFDPVRKGVRELEPQGMPYLVLPDDTYLKKTGKKIPGVKYIRDPMSPPFHSNFIRGQRFLQISALLPAQAEPGPARAIPIDYQHIPPIPKPDRDARSETWEAYHRRQREENKNACAVRRIRHIREQMDHIFATPQDPLVVIGDGGFCNGPFLKPLPERTTFIGRVRADAKFYYPLPNPLSSARGRRRQYGDRAPTPDQLRKDENVQWEVVKAYAAGEVRDFSVKRIRCIYWRKIGPTCPLQLVVIRPLGYRLRKGSRILYRHPGYLICTDPHLPLHKLVQYYVWRYDVEVNHRDEKQIIGVGQAQVRNHQAAERVPTFAVAAYAMLLLAGAQTYGPSATEPQLPLPKWRTKSPRHRLTTTDLIRQLRHDLWSETLVGIPAISGNFLTPRPPGTKPSKFDSSLSSAVLYTLP